MKPFTASAVCLLALSACSVASSDTGTLPDRILTLRTHLQDADDPYVFVIAHRGCWKAAPENSLAAIEACAGMGVDMVEIDVRRTADGHLVLMHDETVDRTTNGTGRVADLTLEEVRALRLKAGAGGPDAALTGQTPPTLAEAMLTAKGRMLVNLDAKADVYGQAFTVIEGVDALDHILMKRRIVAGDGPLRAQSPFDDVLAMPILDQSAGPSAPLLTAQDSLPPIAVELIFTDMDYARAAASQAEAMQARAWVNTLRPEFSAGLTDVEAMTDPDQVWGVFLDLNFSMIQTDEPAALIAYLDREGRR